MTGQSVIRHLLEEPNDPDSPENVLGSLKSWDVDFDDSIKDIIEHAQLLKEQAKQAGVLDMLQKQTSLSSGKLRWLPVDINRAFLLIAVEQYNAEFIPMGKIAHILKRQMHSIWD